MRHHAGALFGAPGAEKVVRFEIPVLDICPLLPRSDRHLNPLAIGLWNSVGVRSSHLHRLLGRTSRGSAVVAFSSSRIVPVEHVNAHAQPPRNLVDWEPIEQVRCTTRSHRMEQVWPRLLPGAPNDLLKSGAQIHVPPARRGHSYSPMLRVDNIDCPLFRSLPSGTQFCPDLSK